jgi:two-component SAPR family response regulator
MNATNRFHDRAILVVEDEFLIAMDMAYAIEEWGASVVGPLGSQTEALDFLARGDARIDVAVLDVNLGSHTAFDIADKLRELDVPVIFVTGYDASSIPERYRGVLRCEKPVDQAELGRALERSMRTRYVDRYAVPSGPTNPVELRNE